MKTPLALLIALLATLQIHQASSAVLYSFSNTSGDLDFFNPTNWTTSSGRTPDPATILVDEEYLLSSHQVTASGNTSLAGEITIDSGATLSWIDGTLSGNGIVAGNLILDSSLGGSPEIAPLADNIGIQIQGDLSAISVDPDEAPAIPGVVRILIDGQNNSRLNVSGSLDLQNFLFDFDLANGAASLTEDHYLIASYGTLLNGDFPQLLDRPGYNIDMAFNDGNTSNNIALVRDRALEFTGPPGAFISEPSPKLFQITFTEPILGLEASDFQISTTGTLQAPSIQVHDGFLFQGPSSYSIALNQPSGIGTLQITLPAGAVTDLEGLASIEGTTFTSGILDFEKPSVTSIEFIEVLSGTNDYRFRINFSEPMDNFFIPSQNHLQLNHSGTSHISISTENPLSLGFTSSTFTVEGLTGSGTFSISIGDGFGSEFFSLRDLHNNRLEGFQTTSAPLYIDSTQGPEIISITPNTTTPGAGEPVTVELIFSESLMNSSEEIEFYFQPQGNVFYDLLPIIQTGPRSYEIIVYAWTDTGSPAGTLSAQLWSGLLLYDLNGNQLTDFSLVGPAITALPFQSLLEWSVAGPANFFEASHWSTFNIPDSLIEEALIQNGGTAIADGALPGNPNSLWIDSFRVGTQHGAGKITLRNLSLLQCEDDFDVSDSVGDNDLDLGVTLYGEALLEDITRIHLQEDLEVASPNITTLSTISNGSLHLNRIDELIVEESLKFGAGDIDETPTSSITLTRNPTVLLENIAKMTIDEDIEIFKDDQASDFEIYGGTADITFRNLPELTVAEDITIIKTEATETGTITTQANVFFDQVIGLVQGSRITIGDHQLQNTAKSESSVSLQLTDSSLVLQDDPIDDGVIVGRLQGGGNNNQTNVNAALTLTRSSLSAENITVGSIIQSTSGSLDASLDLYEGSVLTANSFRCDSKGSLSFHINGTTPANIATAGSPGTHSTITAINGAGTGTATLSGRINILMKFIPPAGTHHFNLITADHIIDQIGGTAIQIPTGFSLTSHGVITEGGKKHYRLTISGAPTPYGLWTKQQGFANYSDTLIEADPNGDGIINAMHFLYNTNPLGMGFDEEDKVRILPSLDDTSGKEHLTITVPVLKEVTITPGSPAQGSHQLFTMHIRGEADLVAPRGELAVEMVPTSLDLGLPPLLDDFDSIPGPDWEYRTFRIATPMNLLPSAFFSLGISLQAP